MPQPLVSLKPAATTIRLAHRCDPAQPHPDALNVIAILERLNAPRGNIHNIRANYAKARKPFLAPLEKLHSHFHIQGATTANGMAVPKLTVIRPLAYETQKHLPVMLFLHGGGWTLGGLDTYEPFCRQLANACGAILVFVHYRLAPEHPFPAAFDDTRAALRWVYENAARLGADEARVIIAGDSAGGNLAAVTALAEKEEMTPYQPWRQILLYPCLDMTACMASHKKFATGYLLTEKLYRWYRDNYLGGFEKPAHRRLSPLFAHDVTGLPPTVLLYAGFDPLRDEAAAYAVKLTLADVKLQTLYFGDMIHGFLTMGGAVAAAHAAVGRIAEALQALND